MKTPLSIKLLLALAAVVFATSYILYPMFVEPVETDVTVSMMEYYFAPDEIYVRKNVKTRITFINNGIYPHNAYVSEEKKEIATILYPGNSTTVEVIFSKSGVYNVLCTIAYPSPVSHYELGMKAKLIVK